MTRKNNKMAAENIGCCCSKAHSNSNMSEFQVFCESTSSSSSVHRGSQLFLLLRIGKVTAVMLTVAAILGNLPHVAAQNQYGGGMVDQKFAMEPQDQTAIVGSRVTLPCRVVGKSGVLQWTKDDFGLGAHRNLSGYERYSMIGSDEEGDFSLDIFPVQLDDDAKYQCQVSAGPLGQPAIRSRFASISVLVPPEAPKILQGSLLQATEDQPIELECVSAGGKPAAEITWIDGEGTVLSARAKHSVLPTADGRRFTARSVLRLVPKRAQHGGTLACQAQNTADRTFRAAIIKLEVKYAPVVSVKILGGAASNGRIPEGAEVRLGCKAEANPNDLTYRWYLNDDLVVGDYTTEMVLYNVSRKLHDSIVKCEVHNAVGKSEESETLDVTYGPRFRFPPTDVAADLGGEVTLSCDLDGNPPPAITWLHEDQDRWSVVGSTPNLTLTVDSATAGRYNCKAAVHGFPEIEADAVVYLKGPPKIVSPRSQIGMEGDSARIECRVISVPRPVHLMWSHAGKEINIHTDQDFSILEDPMADGVKSTLVIRDSQYMHFGTYNCSVTNEYGSDVVEIHLVAQSSFPLQMIIFIFIGAAVIVLIALVIVFFICARRKSKQRAGKEMGGKPDVMVDAEHKDRTSYISDLKHDLKMEEACNPEYAGEEFRTGLPLAGPVPLPADRAALLMQYSRYSNDYSDHAFPPNLDFKDGHNNNAYSGYIDYSRDYNPPPSLPLHVKSPSINGMDSQSASRLHLGSSYRPPSSGGDSLQRRGVGGVDTTDFSHPSGSLQRRKADANSIGIPSVTYDTVGLLQHPNGALKQNGSGMLTPNGVDIRYAATYGNPYLRTAGGLSTVNTANPAATPAPPPYNSIRNSMISMMPSGSNPHISGSSGAQPQAAPQSPASKYIMPVAAPNPAQMVQLTKKGTGTQQSLATHV